MAATDQRGARPGRMPGADRGQAPASADVALRKDPHFVRYFAAGCISLAGSKVTQVAMPVLVYQLTRSPLDTAMVVAAEAIAYLVLGLFAGAMADRVDRRRILVGCDLASAALIATVPVATELGMLSVAQVMVVAALAAAASVFFNAADLGALPTMVGPARLTRAFSASMGAATLIGITGPALTGLALALAAPGKLISLDAASFLASALLLRTIPRGLMAGERTGARPTWRTDIAEGLRFLWRHPVIRPITLVGVAQSALIGATFSEFVPFAEHALGLLPGNWRLGLVFTFWSLGALLASALLPRLTERLSVQAMMLLTTPAAAVGCVGVAIVRGWIPAVLVICAWSTVLAVNSSNTVVYRQRATPEHLVSRVSATGRMLAWGIGNPLGAMAGGAVAEVWGVRYAFVLAAAFGAVATAIAWGSSLRRSGVRGHDRAPDPATPSPSAG
jgi:MFS family permease